MLRLKIDLTSCQIDLKDTFWRLERNGIFQKTIFEYAAFLLDTYGIVNVRPVAYLNGTLLPDSESPLILRDNDLLRISPAKSSNDAQVVPSRQSRVCAVFSQKVRDEQLAQKAHLASNDEPVRIDQSTQNSGSANTFISNESYHTVLEPPETSKKKLHRIAAKKHSVTPESELSGSALDTKKRKRGKRRSRTRSKRVSFGGLTPDEAGQNDTSLMQSTPFHTKVQQNKNESNQSSRDEYFAEKPSEAFSTAVENLPGISCQSKKSMKSSRKLRKATAGMGYYLALLERETNAENANNSSFSGNIDSVTNVHDGEAEPTTSVKEITDVAGSFDISTIQANVTICCDVGIFNAATAEVEHYSNVQLLIIGNNLEKKCLTVKHVQGDIAQSLVATEFKVDWGMLSSVKPL